MKHLASSDSFSLPYDPLSIQTQTLLQGNVSLFTADRTTIGSLGLIITMQLIGYHEKQTNENFLENVVKHSSNSYSDQNSEAQNKLGNRIASYDKIQRSSSATDDEILLSYDKYFTDKNHIKNQIKESPTDSSSGATSSASYSKRFTTSTSETSKNKNTLNRLILADRKLSSSDKKINSSKHNVSNLNTSLSNDNYIGNDAQSSSSHKESAKENILNLKFKNNFENRKEIFEYSDDFYSSSSSDEDQSVQKHSPENTNKKSPKIKSPSPTSAENLPTLAEEKRRKLKKSGKILSQERPKGWLRSVPVFRGNILCEPKMQPQSTRSSFLKLLKNYPDIQMKMQKEIEKQLKEKLKILDEEYVTEIEKLKRRRKVRAHVPAFEPKTAKAVSKLASNNIAQVDKETVIGESILEDIDTDSDIGSELLLIRDAQIL